jgi:hypothetical protein
MPAVLAVSSPMPAVEQVQEWTGEQQQIREDTQHVGGVLRDDEEGPDREKGEEHEARAGPEPRGRSW